MNSSTSSSRNIYSKIMLVILLGMGTAMALVNFIGYLSGGTTENIMGRVVEARAALPKIVEEKQDLVIMFGSSMTDAGFSPRQFDQGVNQQGKNIKSFNFGFGGLNPYFQDYLSRRMREAFQNNDRRLKLAIIEFNPFQTTQTRWNRAEPIVDSFLTMLASDQELWEITRVDPTRGVRLFNIKYARNDISAEMITSFFGRQIFPPARPERREEPEEAREKRRELGEELDQLFKKDYPDFVDADWVFNWQGGGTIPQERTPRAVDAYHELFATYRNEPRMLNDRDSRIRTADIEALNFEPKLVESFIAIVENFKQFSDQVEVVMLPRNYRYITYSPESQARLAAAVRQIEDATGIRIRDHQLIPQVTPDMYSDTTHLARYSGDVAYTNYLVEQFRDSL